MALIAPSRRIPPHQLNALNARIQACYAPVADDPAFYATSEQPLEWGQVLAELRKRRASQSPLAIHEFAAGLSGFPTWPRQQLQSAAANASVASTCQDVTTTNRSHLQQVADAMVISPLHEGVLP